MSAALHPTQPEFIDPTGAAMDYLGRENFTCRICGVVEPLEWEYQRIGACGPCVRKLAVAYSLGHTGEPSADFMSNDEWAAYREQEAARRGQRYQKRPISPGLRMRVFERDGFKCLNCGTQKNLQADHVHPERHGGEAKLENLQTLCKSCNSRKGSRLEGAAS